MNQNKLFIEEIKRFVENGLSLNQAIIEMNEKYGKSPMLISELYQLFAKNPYILTVKEDLDSVVYESLLQGELQKAKTYYGGLVYVAELFELSETYVKCKVEKYKQPMIDYKFTA
ncbi:hypothetical protein [Halalkalibacter urbisdiaboli]|uniref:hypothetical protein n=1 Tax=Halalkalibacter urbisdiaboli TaxID=1960589 RepID=UPI000B432873|nr:hypothetical protein [Halalkalibacter urbisdiaboli]